MKIAIAGTGCVGIEKGSMEEFSGFSEEIMKL